GPHARGQVSDGALPRARADLARSHTQGDRGARALAREDFHLGRTAARARNETRSRIRARGERPPPTPTHRDGTPPARTPSRRALDGRRDSLRAGPQVERSARGSLATIGQRPARRAEEGDAAPRRVLAR